MAARKSTATQRTKSRATASRSRAAVKAQEPEEVVITSNVVTDIILWLCIGAAGLVILSLLGIGGIFGQATSTVLFGFFGIMAFVFPFAIVGGAFFAFSNQLNKKIRLKMTALLVIFVMLCTLVELFMYGEDPLTPIEAFSESHLRHSGGGFFGAVFAWIFFHMFGTVGAYIVTFVAIIICAVIVLEKSPLKNFNDRAPERRKKRREFVSGAKEHIARDIDRIERERELARRHEESRRKLEERKAKNEKMRLEMIKEAERAAKENEKTGQIIEAATFAPPKEEIHTAPLKESMEGPSDEMNEVHFFAAEDATDNLSPIAGMEVPDTLAPIARMDITDSLTPIAGEEISDTLTPLTREDIPDTFAPLDSFVSLDSVESMAPPVEEEAPVALYSDAKEESTARYSNAEEPMAQYSDTAEAPVTLYSNAEEEPALRYSNEEKDPISLYSSAEEEPAIQYSNVENDPIQLYSEAESGIDPQELTEYSLPDDFDFEERTLGTIRVSAEPQDVAEAVPFPEVVRVSAEALDGSVSAEPEGGYEDRVIETDSVMAEDVGMDTDLQTIDREEAVEELNGAAGTNVTEQAAAEAVAKPAEAEEEASRPKPYQYPPLSLLGKSPEEAKTSQETLQKTSDDLKRILSNFGVEVEMEAATCGPTVTRYELKPAVGVKVSKIVNLADDIKLNLAAADIRIEAPIPGKQAVGIEVPNKEPVTVAFGDLMRDEKFRNERSKIAFAAGKDIGGDIIISDIAKMPHLLIAGATGSGKSVCINTIIMSILYKASPDEVKLIMIDPKVVELSVYNGIPHLLIPVVTDPKKATGALNWAVQEMMKRYETFANIGVRKMEEYNSKIIDGYMEIDGEKVATPRMPQIVIIVDELADLMMVASSEVEDAIVRLTQLARAAGIHLVIATQRPSVNVITGLIKANMPSRIAFSVTSGVDSRTILDMVGAEKLLGKGDMLYYPQSITKPLRVQGAFVSDKEVSDVVSYIKKNNERTENAEVAAQINEASAGQSTASAKSAPAEKPKDDKDSYFDDAARLLIDKGKGSIGMLQRYFKVGFNRAARIMDQLAEAGIVGPEVGTKPREVVMTLEEYEEKFASPS